MKTNKIIGFILTALLIMTAISSSFSYSSAMAASNSEKKVTVSNQKKLNAVLKDKNVRKIVIKTEKQTTFKIKKGSYKKKTIVVNAPKADVINKGTFKEIKIKAINTDTWTEKTNGNTFYISAAAGRIVIPEDSGIKNIVITGVNSNFQLEVRGNLDSLVLDSKTNVDINVVGTVSDIRINDRATLNINGSSSSSIPISMSGGADGTAVTSNVPVNIDSAASADIRLKEGAEGSSVSATDAGKPIEITNNTSSGVTYTSAQGDDKQIGAGQNVTLDGTGTIVSSTTDPSYGNETHSGNDTLSVDNTPSGTPSSGNNPSGGNNPLGGDNPVNPSGNISRYIVRFKTSTVFAGFVGNLKEEKDLGLPEYTYGEANDGKTVKFAVKSWTNTDNYSTSVEAGYYTYTAVLGNSDISAKVDRNIIATCRIQVLKESGIIYDSENTEYNHISVINIINAKDGSTLLELKNENTVPVTVSGNIKFYKAGVLQCVNSVFAYIPAKSIGYAYGDRKDGLSYDTYLFTAHVGQNDSFGEPSSITVEVGGKGEGSSFPVSVKNNSTRYVSNVGLVYIVKRGDIVLSIGRYDVRDIRSGATSNGGIGLRQNEMDADSIAFYTCYVFCTEDSVIPTDNRIVYSNEKGEYNHLTVTNVILGKYGSVLFEIKNENSVPVDVGCTIRFYKNGILQSVCEDNTSIKETSIGYICGYLHNGASYDTYIITATVSKNANVGDSSTISITVGDKKDDISLTRFPLTVKNTGSRYILKATLIYIARKRDEVVSTGYHYINDIASGAILSDAIVLGLYSDDIDSVSVWCRDLVYADEPTAPTESGIIYSKENGGYNHISVTRVLNAEDGSIMFELKNENSIPVIVNGTARYYKAGILQFVCNINTLIPEKSTGYAYGGKQNGVSYDIYSITADVEKDETLRDMSLITITVEEKKSDTGTYFPITVKNNSTKYVSGIFLVYVIMKGDKVLSIRNDNGIDGIASGATLNKNIILLDNETDADSIIIYPQSIYCSNN